MKLFTSQNVSVPIYKTTSFVICHLSFYLWRATLGCFISVQGFPFLIYERKQSITHAHMQRIYLFTYIQPSSLSLLYIVWDVHLWTACRRCLDVAVIDIRLQSIASANDNDQFKNCNNNTHIYILTHNKCIHTHSKIHINIKNI